LRCIKKCSRCSITGRSARDKIVVSHEHAIAVVVVDGVDVTGKEWKTLPADKVLVVGAEPPAKLIDFKSYQAPKIEPEATNSADEAGEPVEK
jgi:hypothetical protein